MKLLVVNPNTSADVTALVEAEARRSAAPSTEVVMGQAPYGFEYIETRFEALIAGGAVAETIAAHQGDVDAVVVAAFGDPGLPGLKELVGVPVVGISEAAMCAAALQGQRFSIVAISDRISSWYRECVDRFGFAGRLASIRSLRGTLGAIGSVQEDFRAALVALAGETVRMDGADVVILAGAPLAGLAREVAHLVDVPLVDGVSAGVRLAEAMAGLAALSPSQRRAGAYSAPPVKARSGLSAPLEAALVAAQEDGLTTADSEG